MQYSEGRLGRVFVVKIDDGEDFLAVTQEFVTSKDITTGTILFLGALRQARMVTGPEELVIPPDPHYVMFDGGWEMVGLATICKGENGPSIHYHASVGRAGHALTGCLRERATTYLVAEAVILEFAGLSVARQFDERMQVNLPVHAKTGEPRKTVPDMAGEPEEPAEKPAKKDEEEDAPGGLAEIIRDLTRRPKV